MTDAFNDSFGSTLFFSFKATAVNIYKHLIMGGLRPNGAEGTKFLKMSVFISLKIGVFLKKVP